MKVVLQRVNHAKVTSDKVNNQIKKGFLLLVGLEEGDQLEDVERIALKISKTRLFEDENGKLNLDIKQVSGSILSISQFTLAANTKKGNRPSFTNAMEPNLAKEYYEKFNEIIREQGISVLEGDFGNHMNIELDNDGPVTIIFE